MQCDMCGQDGFLFCTEVEGTRLDLCQNCSKFGKVLFSKRPVMKKESKKAKIVEKAPEPEIIELLVEDYANKIKSAREKLGLKQIEFAKRISEKESIVQNMETGKFQPPITLARKLERFLNIRLVEEIEEKPIAKDDAKPKDGPLTLGDFVKVRKKK
ncbi:TIGR00270 family protein [Candidatus Woesearchaeota archaeon CG11_big_fil_rev_8_21_14_0_20_43_8]|nr:MAG: TIGR00270 family protein [Candidatus Woesearchaeota archaeon CG11_big_fil_rev_8_21_14_0_20_43_8]